MSQLPWTSFDEDVVAPTGLILGRAATVQGASPGARFVASVTVVQDSQNGEASFNLVYRDRAGNVGTAPETGSTDGTAVDVDTRCVAAGGTLVTSLAIASDNARSGQCAIEGDVVVATIETSEYVPRPVVTSAPAPWARC